MKFMIRCDMEGVTGVVSYEQAVPGKPEYEYGRRMFMSDLLAAIEGLRAGGADEVVVYDEHYGGRNIDMAALPEYARAICGKPPYREDWAGGLDESFDGMALVGLHSKFGTPDGLLHHTYERDIADLALNGVSVGEIGMEAAIAGDYGVPVVLVTGDSAGVAEAKELLPGAVGISVKESLGGTGGCCYPATETAKWIRRGASEAVRLKPSVAPYRVTAPVTLSISFNPGVYLDALRSMASDAMTDRFTLVLEGRTATEVWAAYWRQKLACQKAL